MALVINDRVKETSTTTGTGTFDLAGAVSGFETFVAGIGNSNTTYYAIVNENGEFEVGLGTVTDAATDTLARTTIISSSNSDSAVNFAAGTKDVFCTLPASKAVILDASGNIVANNGSNLTALNATQLTSGTVPDARFPATLPALNGSALTALNASNLASGTVANARLDAQLQDVAGLATTAGKIIQGDGSNFALSAYTLPTSDGSASQVLTTDGSGAVTFATPTVGDITAVTAGTNLTGGGSSGDVTINLADASTSAKGAASFSSDNFAASSGAITIKDLGVATAEIQNDAVTQAKIADDAVGADQLAADAVVTASIVDVNVTTAKIADDAITLAKMAPGTDGNIISYDASGNPVAVATGNDGQVLTSTGAGSPPAFETLSVPITGTANGADNRIATYSSATALNGEANLTFDGSTLNVDGAITTTGNITTDHVLPTANDTFDLGASDNVWRNVYTGDLHLSNEAKAEGNSVDGTKGNWTIQEGEESLYILNNKNGKKYRFNLEEI